MKNSRTRSGFAGVWMITTAAVLSWSAPACMPPGGREGDEWPSKPRCNPSLSNSCGVQYGNELAGLRSEIDALGLRQKVLPAEITNSLNARSLVAQNHAQALAMLALRESALADAKDRGERLRGYLSQIDAVSFKLISSAVRESLPRLVQELRHYLTNREVLIADRLREIEAALAQATTPNQIQVLTNERDRLLDIQVFVRRYASEAEAKEYVRSVLSGEKPGDVDALPLVTRTLVMVAVRSQQTYSNASEVLDQLEANLNTLKINMRADREVAVALIGTREQEVGAAKADVTRLAADLQAATASADALTAELASIPGRIAEKRRRENAANLYWNCCDNDPFCFELPKGLGAFEGKVNGMDWNWVRPRCAHGSDF